MSILAANQRDALAELVEWWEDLHDCSTGSRLVTLVVPTGWGASTTLKEFEKRVSADGTRLGAVLRLEGRRAPEGLGPQIVWLRGLLEDQGFFPKVQRALGLDHSEGVAEVGIFSNDPNALSQPPSGFGVCDTRRDVPRRQPMEHGHL